MARPRSHSQSMRELGLQHRFLDSYSSALFNPIVCLFDSTSVALDKAEKISNG